MTGQNGDVYSLETADGEILFFPDGVFAWTDWGNFGAPPTTFLTRRGYKQDGVTEIDFLLESRDLPITLWRNGTCDRQQYWDNRAELLDFLRPNRGGPLTLTVRTPNDDMRSIRVRANPGLMFPSQAGNQRWNVDEAVEFIAFNPLWFDAEATVLAMQVSQQVGLVFPITFPITFGTSNTEFTSGVITYVGTWREYPIITLTGPYSNATIINQTTGAVIFMSVAIAAGQQRIIDLTPGEQSITDQDGNNRFSDLGAGSNLVNFNFQPHPIVPNGEQEMKVTFVDGTVASAATLTYRNRYFGI